jgi:hypothetical protein
MYIKYEWGSKVIVCLLINYVIKINRISAYALGLSLPFALQIISRRVRAPLS